MKPSAVIADMAGTTVRDEGVVLSAFGDALEQLDIRDSAEQSAALDYVVETMGQSKIEVFTVLFGVERAHQANAAFETAFVERIKREGVEPIEGVPELFRSLHSQGIMIALTTGFSPSTRDALLDQLGWSEIIPVAISPDDAGRGRPFPDMVLLACSRLGIEDTSNIVVVGDTASDMAAGVSSGAKWVVGVLSGTDNEERLRAAGATHVVSSISEIESLWGPQASI